MRPIAFLLLAAAVVLCGVLVAILLQRIFHLPVAVIVGLLSGAVLTETIFNFSGVGRTISEAITARDYVVVQGFTVIVSIGYVLVNLLTDISYAYLDPRVRMEG